MFAQILRAQTPQRGPTTKPHDKCAVIESEINEVVHARHVWVGIPVCMGFLALTNALILDLNLSILARKSRLYVHERSAVYFFLFDPDRVYMPQRRTYLLRDTIGCVTFGRIVRLT